MTLINFILIIVNKFGLFIISQIKDPNVKLYFTIWDLCQKGLWHKFSSEMKSWVRMATANFGGCSLMIHWFHEFAHGIVGNQVVYLVAPTKVTRIDQLEGHWMNVSIDGSIFMDGYNNGIKSSDVGSVVYLNNQKYYVAWIGDIKQIPPSLGAAYVFCNLYRFVYWMKDR